ncbi:MAG: DUF2971 domain-containing protein [Gammaproteobacteria bacterium]|nr:DUF2971 domain-containing protein [Gammaproteobacteria bacterium]MCP5195395.1 DUF2971 domain-containing protein [Gammaproteobacteria bacterium]
MIQDITRKLYSDVPQETLYHYTSFKGLLGIVDSGVLWASDIRYMNDSAEMTHTADLIREEIRQRIADGHPNSKLLNQFLDWVSYRITNGHMLFGGSFRSNGNLLSQWRGYSALGKGVSIGFDPRHIVQCAQHQMFQVGKCIYQLVEQRRLIAQIVEAVETLAERYDDAVDRHSRPLAQAYYGVFERIESDLLRIAALLKHPSFQEEEEWRIVSPVLTDYVTSPVLFREGTSMLVPYLEFHLRVSDGESISLEHLYLGPTPNISLSMNSLAMFLAKRGIRPRQGISYCQIPYRQW